MEARIDVDTALGPIWFRGRDTGRPMLLILLGAFAEEDVLSHCQRIYPHMDVLRAHLPGNHCPPLAETSVAAFARALQEALGKRLPGRPMVVTGLSTGALVALGLRSPQIRRLVLVEPPLLTEGVWPFWLYRQQMPPGGETFVWEIFGVDQERIAPRDYSALLDGLETPTQVLVGDIPLQPPRSTPVMPSLISDAAREILSRHPCVELEVAPGAGHNVPKMATLPFFLAIEKACREAFGADAVRRAGS